MKLFNRRPKLSLDDQLAAEVKRTGIEVEIEYSTWSLRWHVNFLRTNQEIRDVTSRESAIRSALVVLADAPDSAVTSEKPVNKK